MKAAIYNPYWDTLGGGERYVASVIQFLLEQKYKVDIQWSDKDLINQVSKRFDLSIEGSRLVPDINRGDGYDLLFWVSDGSIPTLKSRNNILHFQFPFKGTNGRSLMNKMKLFRIKHIVCNSEFTKSFIDKEYSVNSTVIYPPVDTQKFKPKRKEKKILYVGRFSQLTQSKNQHILVEVFKKFYDSGHKDWKLILAGGAEVGAKDYVEKLRNESKGYPISIKVSPSFKELKELYGISKIFWSAVGLGFESDPLKVEHFGMTVVEAMSAKCIPIVPELGGFKEIINDGTNGIFWKTKGELLSKTIDLVKDSKPQRRLAVQAKEDGQRYDIQEFEKSFKELL